MDKLVKVAVKLPLEQTSGAAGNACTVVPTSKAASAIALSAADLADLADEADEAEASFLNIWNLLREGLNLMQRIGFRPL